MIEIFLCHAPEDRAVATAIAARLERVTGLKLWLQVCGQEAGELIPVAWDAGLAAAGILLLLSPDSVPAAPNRTDWQALLDHVESPEPPPVATLLVRECAFPQLLKRKSHFVWKDGSNDVLRELERWVISVYASLEKRTFTPGPVAKFAGRRKELDELWTRLVDDSGTVVLAGAAACGKSSLAQQFAWAAAGHFRDILWVECGDRDREFIAGDLAAYTAGRERRVLVVLEDVRGAVPMVAAPGGLPSVLITTRNARLAVPAHARVLELKPPKMAPPEPAPEAGTDEDRLLRAMSVCRSTFFPRSLAEQASGLATEAAGAALERLRATGHVESVSATSVWLRLPERAQSGDTTCCAAHAEAVCGRLREHRAHPLGAWEALGEAEHALAWSMEHDWALAIRLARYAFAFLKEQQRLAQAVVVIDRLHQAAERRGDAEVVENCQWELSWVRAQDGSIQRPLEAVEQLGLDFA